MYGDNRIDVKEAIASLLLDHQYPDPDQRPDEETCHTLADNILDLLELIETEEWFGR